MKRAALAGVRPFSWLLDALDFQIENPLRGREVHVAVRDHTVRVPDGGAVIQDSIVDGKLVLHQTEIERKIDNFRSLLIPIILHRDFPQD